MTSQHILTHPPFQESPTDLLHLVAILVDLQIQTVNLNHDTAEQIADAIAQTLEVITTLTAKYHFSLTDLINLIKKNLIHTNFAFVNIINFSIALDRQLISADNIHKKLKQNKPILLHHYTAIYLDCLAKSWMHPGGHFTLTFHLLDDFLFCNHPHHSQGSYLDYLAKISTADEKINPLHMPAKNIVDALLDEFLTKVHTPDPNGHNIALSFWDTYPFYWEVSQSLTADSLHQFYLNIQKTFHYCFDSTPYFPNKEIFIAQYFLKKKALTHFTQSILRKFIQTYTIDFNDFHNVTHELIGQLSAALNELLTSQAMHDFALFSLTKVPKFNPNLHNDFKNIDQLKSSIASIIYPQAIVLKQPFQKQVDHLTTMIHRFILHIIPWFNENQKKFPTSFKVTIQHFMKYHHFYLTHLCFLQHEEDTGLIENIHTGLMSLLNKETFDITYYNFLKLTYKHFLTDKGSYDTESNLHHINIIFIKVSTCIELDRIDIQDFNTLINLVTEHRATTTSPILYPIHILLDILLLNETFKELLDQRITSKQWLDAQSEVLRLLLPVKNQSTDQNDSDMEIDDN